MLLNIFFSDAFADWGVLVLRVALGVIMIAHGWSKFRNLSQTSSWMESVGFKPGKFWGPVVTFVEVVGGAALILGIWTHVFALLMAGQFVTIIAWKIGKGDKMVGGWEFDLIILGAATALLFYGAGTLSLDSWLGLL